MDETASRNLRTRVTLNGQDSYLVKKVPPYTAAASPLLNVDWRRGQIMRRCHAGRTISTVISWRCHYARRRQTPPNVGSTFTGGARPRLASLLSHSMLVTDNRHDQPRIL